MEEREEIGVQVRLGGNEVIGCIEQLDQLCPSRGIRCDALVLDKAGNPRCVGREGGTRHHWILYEVRWGWRIQQVTEKQ